MAELLRAYADGEGPTVLRLCCQKANSSWLELTRLSHKCLLSGSVYFTLKYDGQTKPALRKGSVEGAEPSDNKPLLRTMDREKITTVVSSKEVSFRWLIQSQLRANLGALKKRAAQHGEEHWIPCFYQATELLFFLLVIVLSINLVFWFPHWKLVACDIRDVLERMKDAAFTR